jgi:cobyrinic acid a,c-diamide synthase
MTRALIIGAPRSGSGKTTITLALLAALRRRGVAVRAGKSGPDYIDPAFHAAASGAPGVNLDSWAMAPTLLDQIASNAAADSALFLIESSMGLFDGIAAAPGRSGAAADLAARFALPVVLVLDVSGQSQSAAAVARGFMLHDPAVRIAGVILNQVASPRHREGVANAMAAIGLPILGTFPRDASLRLPERHLGLIQASETEDLHARLERLADAAEAHLDLDAIAAIATEFAPNAGAPSALPPPGQRIALAVDAAFSFVYPHLLQSWRRNGAEIHPFSPLADDAPDQSCDVCWLPGGYPELHAETLANATQFQTGLAHFATTRPVHGECGGYMVLGATLEDAAGVTHPMANLLGHATSYRKRSLHLGYREATLCADGILGRIGQRIRGHEFHYASVIDPGPDAAFATLTDGTLRPLGLAGGRRGLVSGTFFHAIARQEDA